MTLRTFLGRLFLPAFLCFVFFVPSVMAEGGLYFKAEVTEIIEEGKDDFGKYQILGARLLGTDTTITFEAGDIFDESASHDLAPGDVVVVQQLENGEFSFLEKYRLPKIYFLAFLFFLLVFAITRKRGVFALFGLFFSIAIILYLVIPWVVSGNSPLFIGVCATILIAGVTMFLAHGFQKTTLVALTGTSLTMVLAGIFSVFAVRIAEIFGVGSEAAMQVQLGSIGSGDFRGLLLAGILIGALGVLDDVTMSQSAAIEQLKRANRSFGWKELYHRGFLIGKEHLLSMINTLFLAYAGAFLPLFLLFSANELPAWVVLNSEMISEEIVRTLAGSTAIVLGVPITTFLAAIAYGNTKKEIPKRHHVC
jgi:uncharacterized membrane protein